jgi:hypothetical protein
VNPYLAFDVEVEAGTERGGEDSVVNLSICLPGKFEKPDAVLEAFFINFQTYLNDALIKRDLNITDPQDQQWTTEFFDENHGNLEETELYLLNGRVRTVPTQDYECCVNEPIAEVLKKIEKIVTKDHPWKWTYGYRYGEDENYGWRWCGEILRDGNAD